MSSIFALLNHNQIKLTNTIIEDQSKKGILSGSESSKIFISNKIFLSCLSINKLTSENGLDKRSEQPLKYNNKILICNGEIYNYKHLYKLMNIKATTTSDCEVIIHLYEKYGIDYMLKCLDGVYAFILIDNDVNKIFIGRDKFGERPLFYLANKSVSETWDPTQEKNILGFSSTMKQLYFFTQNNSEYTYKGEHNLAIEPFDPGSYMVLEKTPNDKWFIANHNKYEKFNLTRITQHSEEINMNIITNNIHDIFFEAVYKRIITTTKPIACLLSGGLDSSIVAALVSKIYDKPIQTYSIGLEGSEDLKYARDVAKHIKSNHTEVIVSEEDFFASIVKVIEIIESYDTTTIRAGVGNLLIAQYISETSDAKVIFNGDGSDELMGGYLYMNYAPDALEFDKECKRLLNDISRFDVLRSTMCISTNGLESRSPFLDLDFIAFYFSIPANYRYETNKKQEKYLFRKAFDRDYLPSNVLWRKKEAFSDGVSSKERSWHKIIEDFVTKQKTIKYDNTIEYTHNTPETMEQLYYRTIYDSIYKNQSRLIPYFWMPKYVDADDCSARSLSIYNMHNIDNIDNNEASILDEYEDKLIINSEDEEELSEINLND
jgi:asparagine synthase (glutamine-hydrolysing)